MLDKKINILAEDCIKVDNYLYMIAMDYNVIFRVGIEDGKIEFVSYIPEENSMDKRLGAKILLWKNELIFSPMNAEKIWRYNLETKEWKYHERKKIEDWKKSEMMFQAIQYKEKLIFIGSTYPAIIILNLTTNEMEYIEEPYLKYKDLAIKFYGVFFRADCVALENKIYVASCLKNEIFVFDMDSYEHKYIKVGEESFIFSGIDYDGNNFYISPRRKGPLIIWDGSEKYTTIEVFKDDRNNTSTFGGVLCKEDSVIFWNRFSENSYILEDKQDMGSIKAIPGKYLFYTKVDEDTYVSLTIEGHLTIDDKDKHYEYDLTVSCQSLGKFILEREEKKRIFAKESAGANLELFLNLI